MGALMFLFRAVIAVVFVAFACTAMGLLIVWLASPPAKARAPGSGIKALQTIRPLDQPRCFPPGTIVIDGVFPGCPDTLPSMKAT